jgi:ferredoxin-nitrite reductase
MSVDSSVSSIACPGLFYPTPSEDGLITRIRIPGGDLSHVQATAIADFADNCGATQVLITNRANLQIRSPRSVGISAAEFKYFQTIGLAAPIAAVDHLRNLMVSPTAGIDGQAVLDSRSIVQQLDQYISHQPELAGLSAKFSIGIDANEIASIRHRYNDVWLIAIDAQHLRLGLGGSNHTEIDAGIEFSIAHAVSIIAAIAQVYLQYAPQLPSAQTQHRRSQKPRLYHLIEHWGIDWIIDRLHEFCPIKLTIAPPNLALTDRAKTDRYPHLGIQAQTATLSYIGVIVPLGRLTVNQLRHLATIAKTYGSGELRLTPWQNLLIPHITNSDLITVQQTLFDAGLSTDRHDPAGAIVACAGRSGCAAAETDTQSDAQQLLQQLAPYRFDQPINIHVSGCAKGCAQPYASDIALMGVAPDAYVIYRRDGQQTFGEQLYPAMTATQAIDTVMKQITDRFLHTDPKEDQC